MPLKVVDLQYGYHGKSLFKKVNLSFDKRGCYSLVGPSGSGKTTLLKCIAQIIEDYQGEVYFNELNLAKTPAKLRVQNMGYVAQQYHLFNHMNVLQNCIHPQMIVLGKSRAFAQAQAISCLESLDVLEHKDKYPSQLSGGQQQRVAMARALCMGSKFLCLDEPTAALDPVSKEKLKQVLLKLKASNHTILMSTHDIPFAQEISDEVIELNTMVSQKQPRP